MPQALEAASWRPAASPPPAPGTVFAQRGDRPADVAQRYGVDEQALLQANPGLREDQHLLPGQDIRLPQSEDGGLSPAFAGVSAAVGREGLVQALQDKAYRAGREAPQHATDVHVMRAVGTAHEAGVLDHKFGSAGRYNAPGQRMLYTAPDVASVLHEGAAYAKDGQHALAGKSVVELNFRATLDAAGKGGVSDIAEGARRVGLPVSALTEPKGGKPPSLLNQLTGEHPYTLSQQASKGASDMGATALRAPAATCDAQIDILPRNAQPHQITPLQVTRYDATGRVTAGPPAAGLVRPMPVDTQPYVDGPLSKRAGDRSAANQAPEAAGTTRVDRARQFLTDAQAGYPRASSVRYGAAGGAAAALIDAGVRASRGEQVDGVRVAGDAAQATALGGVAAKAVDGLAPRVGRFGLVKAGGAVGAVLQAGVSGVDNVQAYRAGKISGARAAANTVVDTGTALVAGGTGAAVGAAVGSVVPIAGTAVGAVTGFVVGVGVHYAIGAADKALGLTSRAKDWLTSKWQ